MKAVKIFSAASALLLGWMMFAWAGPAALAQQPETPEITEMPEEKPAVDLGEVVRIGQDFTLKSNQVARSVVVIGGNARIDGRVRREVVVVGGSASISGSLGNDLVAVLTPVSIAAGGEVEGEVIIVGGPAKIDEAAKVHSQRVVGFDEALPDLAPLRDWFVKGLLLMRPLPPQVGLAWTVAGVMLILYLLIAAAFPRSIQICADTLSHRPASSFAAGILTLVLLGPLCLLLILSVVGIPVVPILFCALALAVLWGKTAVYSLAGQQFGRGAFSFLRNPILALLLGAALFYLVYMIPVIGFLAWGAVTLIGFGAVMNAMFNGFRKDVPSDDAALSVPVRLGEPAAATAATSVSSIGSEGGANMETAATTAAAVAPSPPLVGATVAQPEVIFMRRVGFWLRFWASLLDFILFSIITSFLGPFAVLLFVAYFVGMWTWRGTSIGGIVLGLKIVRLDGGPINFAVALVRSLSSLFSAMVLFLGFFWAGWDREKQAWHDKIAGTVVVRVPKGVSLL